LAAVASVLGARPALVVALVLVRVLACGPVADLKVVPL
jgi:low affinity Fe/Cu permease